MHLKKAGAVLLVFCHSLSADDEFQSVFDMDLEQLMNLSVITGGKIEQSQALSPSVLAVITAAEIEQFGANNLAEVLDRATSVKMLGSFFYPQNLAVIRGIQLTHSNNEVLVLINGRPLRDSFTGGENFSIYTAFPVEIIKQIEIIRGPGSALYGSNAFTGVINIITKNLKFKPELKVGIGQWNALTGSYINSGESENLSYNYGVRYFSDDGWQHQAYDNNGLWGSFDTGEKNYSAMFTASSKSFDINLFHAMSQQNFWGATSTWTGDPVQQQRKVSSTRNLLDLGHKKPITADLKLESNLSYSDSKFEHYNYDATSRNWLLETTLYYNLDAGGSWLTGATVWNQDIETVSHTDRPEPIPAFSRNWFSVYSQYQSLTNDVFNWTLGVQVKKIPKVKANIVPRLSANIALNDSSGLKLNYGRAFRSAYAAETNFDLVICCDEQGNNQGGLRDNPSLEPESITTQEMQYYWKTASLHFSSTLFYSELSDLIERERNPDDNILDFVNRGELEVMGVELEGKVELTKKTRINFSYTYQENKSNGTDNYTLMPNHMAKIGFSHLFDNQIKLGIFNSWFSKYHNNQIRNPSSQQLNPKASAYNLLTADISYSFNFGVHQAEVSLYGHNLLDEDIYQPEFAGRRINTHPAQGGRAWYLSYRMSF